MAQHVLLRHDATADVARSFTQAASAAGWTLIVLDLPQGGKPNALNHGDSMARSENRAYLDADVIVSPAVMAELMKQGLINEDALTVTGKSIGDNCKGAEIVLPGAGANSAS